MRAFGYNGYGQLGDGTTYSHSHPLPVVDERFVPIGAIGGLAAGWRHGLALAADGRLLSWGDNAEGQLGDGLWSDRSRAAPVGAPQSGDLGAVATIAAGGYHNLALLTDGTLLAWGDNSQGQLGGGVGADRRSPASVTDAAGSPIQGLPQTSVDSDGDGIEDSRDNCPLIANSDQDNLDGDSEGDVCDPDIDGDGVANEEDAFPYDPDKWEAEDDFCWECLPRQGGWRAILPLP